MTINERYARWTYWVALAAWGISFFLPSYLSIDSQISGWNCYRNAIVQSPILLAEDGVSITVLGVGWVLSAWGNLLVPPMILVLHFRFFPWGSRNAKLIFLMFWIASLSWVGYGDGRVMVGYWLWGSSYLLMAMAAWALQCTDQQRKPVSPLSFPRLSDRATAWFAGILGTVLFLRLAIVPAPFLLMKDWWTGAIWKDQSTADGMKTNSSSVPTSTSVAARVPMSTLQSLRTPTPVPTAQVNTPTALKSQLSREALVGKWAVSQDSERLFNHEKVYEFNANGTFEYWDPRHSVYKMQKRWRLAGNALILVGEDGSPEHWRIVEFSATHFRAVREGEPDLLAVRSQ